MRTPEFWFKKRGVIKYLLYPATYLWKAGLYFNKLKSKPLNFPVPIICVGNIIMGGGGKTPLVIELSKDLNKQGKKTHIIYKAFNTKLEKEVFQVKGHHNPNKVGDEPLLACKYSKTWIAKNRKIGIEEAIKDKADIILLDDGYQDYSIEKDLLLLVINSRQGFGNQLLFPSGPLRENIKTGVEKADCIFFYGIRRQFNNLLPKLKKPVFFLEIVACKEKLKKFKKKKLIAFAGIAHPDNFFNTLSELKLDVEKKFYFSDHKKYSEMDILSIINKSNSTNNLIVTTEKDFTKIPEKYKNKIDYLPISIEYDKKQFMKIIEVITND